MKIKLTNVYVDDQEKALRFYTEKLGFVKKADFSQGTFRWLTVVSPEDPGGVELVLQLVSFVPPAKTYQQALHQQGTPAAMFFVDDVKKEHERLTKLGVRFTQPPVNMGPVTTAVFEDTCGNLLQIAQRH